VDPDPDADPDPSIFIIDHQDANKKLIKKSFSAYYFLEVLLHNFSKVKSKKEVTFTSFFKGKKSKSSQKTVEIKVFLTNFA
jgi:ribosomal protein L23